ncbi:MAG: bifunctional YncE family protein/alkaline phosphatase family protein [Verrucomicrobiota bacterium]|jgi:YVTN family beta-propeller protein
MQRVICNLFLSLFLVCPLLRAEDSPEDFDATTAVVGQGTNGLETPVNQLVTPAGIFVELPGVRPNALALSPDSRLLVTSGLTNELLVADPASGKIIQYVKFPAEAQKQALKSVSPVVLDANLKAKLSFTGITFSPDGSRIYLSNVNGDIKVFGVGTDHLVSPLFSIPLPPVNAGDRTNDIPAGIAVSPDGANLYVALNVANRLAELDATSGKLLRTWNVGVAPFDVVLAHNKLYVSNWGGRRPDADSPTGPIGENGVVRVDDNSVASEGSVSVIHLDAAASSATTNNAPAEIVTGRHACALALSPNGRYLVCANAGNDTLSVIDTRTDSLVETICARQNPGDLFGAQPDALVFDNSGKKIYVCNGTQNAVAVFQFKPGESELLGLVPVGWFPGAIVFDSRRQTIDVANLKSISPGREAAKKGHGPGFNTHQYYGSLSLVPLPTKAELKQFTQTALANLRYPLLAQAKLRPRNDEIAKPVPERVGEPGVFQHVIYIIKENRSYDQVLGDLPQGNGDPDLCIFGQRVTPNQHKFCNDFVLLDNTYCSGILSADGHQWTDSGLATEYVERSFAGWPRSYPAGGEADGRDALAYSPEGFIWTDAAAHGKSVADFGEFTADHHYWQGSHQPETNWLDSYHDFISGANAIDYSCEPDIEGLRPFIVTNYLGFDLDVPDIFRASRFIQDLKQYEAADTFPNLVIVWLPDDHTSGTRFRSPTPEAQVADNDLAFGQIVDAVSHSKFWTNTCIFAIEDDPQDGWDHLSAYRTTAYVISPYTKRHQVVSTQYNHTSLLRTIELILGLPPMNQMDATATPMFDCFNSTPDYTAYDAVTNTVPLDEMNPLPKKIRDAQLRKDALVSAKLPLDKEDQCPEDLFNHILWRSVKGSQIPYPDWAVKSTDDD